MQLSEKVALQTPSSGPTRKQTLLPTGGLNQRQANISITRGRRAPERKESEQDAPKKTGDQRANPKPGFKHLKMAQSLERVSLTHKQKAREKLPEDARFSDYPLLPEILEGLMKDVFAHLEAVQPSPVQKLAIPALLNARRPLVNGQPHRFLLAAETGSGKTLAYCLPIVDALKRDEIEAQERDEELKRQRKESGSSIWEIDPSEIDPPDTRPRPKALILLPTSELVSQVGSVIKKLTHKAKFRARQLSSDMSRRMIRSGLKDGCDIMIATPQLFASIAMRDPAILSECKYIVADEADSLFDRSFVNVTNSIIVRATLLHQLVLCSATIPTSLDKRLRRDFPEITRLVTPNIHAIPRRVTMSIVDIDDEPYKGNKMLACADILYSIAKDPGEPNFVKKVIVFVNQRESTAPLAEYIRSKGIDAVELDRDSASRQKGSLDFFVGPKTPLEAKKDQGNTEGYTPRKIDTISVLVTTDIASRGIDTITVKNVILYDVPYSTVDFIHRMGRTGRMGKRGRAVVLVDKHTNKAWVREVKSCMHVGAGLI